MYAMIAILSITIVNFFYINEASAQEPSPWSVHCAEEKEPETCRMVQVQSATKEVDGKIQPIGKILGLTVIYVTDAQSKKRTPYMSIQMPLGVDLRAGAVIKVDDNKEINLKYLRCTQQGCDTSLELNSKLLRSILAGIDFNVGFRAWGSDKTTLVKASLTGFTKAFRRLK